ncbi:MULTISPECIES: EAL domain-containing protein [unclassified Devosia]|uniref:bifunctional diguanylate cyclase/phosphodiesterase n=1 Tax=unclassified Devosia TaxID=196773 RepID=UPI000FDC4E74|nr:MULTISPECIES: EAL domain-containing protein [unclassified Devosia]
MLLPAILALVVIATAGVWLDRQNTTIEQGRIRSSVASQASLIRARLEGNINANLQLVRGMVAAIASEPDMTQTRFQELAGILFEQPTQLRSLAAAPDFVVRMVYPLAGNERAMGLDYRINEVQRDAAMRSRDSHNLVIAGPVDLVQGGQGIIGRFPIYTKTAQGERFWGILSAIVDVDRLYAESGLLDRGLPIEVSIAGKDAQGSDGELFFGRDLAAQNPIRATVLLPSGSWELTAIPKGGWPAASSSWIFRLVLVGAGALVLLPILVTARMLNERHVHFQRLKQSEQDLARLSRRLGLALATSQVGVWEMDIHTQELLWDDRMNELYGLPADGGRRSYRDWQKALHPDDRYKAEHDFAEAMLRGHYHSDFRVQRADGAVRHLRGMGAVFTDPGSNPKIVGVNWDVTADVSLNEDLQRAQRLTAARNIELEAARVRIEHNALHDSLTGLPNRRFLDDILKALSSNSENPGRHIALLHLDLDRFKQINDTMGHAAGDAMLVHVSRVLRDSCEPGSFVARVGGDEFVVVLTDRTGDAELTELAERIISRMQQPISFEAHECRCGVSIGIAVDDNSPAAAEQLLINADIALYRAKKRGRNRHEFFSAALQAEVVNTKRIADDILSGLERNEFIAFYQPQFDARTHNLVSVEALARWQHPRLGLLTPDAFLAVAEDLNVLSSIDRILLDQTLNDLRHWDGLGLQVPRASVNVSLRRLHDENLIQGLKQRDIEPGRLAFELVESIYLDEQDPVVAWNIDQLKELGIDVEIDDFGTGYASIVSLQRLRPRRLKIDRQLVRPITVDPAQRQLLASIVDIGKSMGIQVVAEGVETLEQASLLRDLGCDILQGYAFARPMSRDNLDTFLQVQAWRHAS